MISLPQQELLYVLRFLFLQGKVIIMNAVKWDAVMEEALKQGVAGLILPLFPPEQKAKWSTLDIQQKAVFNSIQCKKNS